jgi:hypothetical protein
MWHYRELFKLERENNELMANLDSLEQYGRRSLIRVAGISEGGSDEDTNTIVQKIISDIWLSIVGQSFSFSEVALHASEFCSVCGLSPH